jgi:tetratricopeptide (TPR) repeat protein
MSAEPDYEIQKLNQLAFPRDFNPKCELTGLNATVQLMTMQFGQPFTLYYVNQEVAEQAWFGIIKKIVHLLAPLTTAAPIVGTQEERTKRANNVILSKRSLIDFCLSESSNLLSVQKYQLAIPAAIQALKFSKEIDGEKSVSVVEPYLQLAQAYLGLKEHGKAEEFLALARWVALSSDEVSDKTRSRLHMLIGRVNTARGNFEGAKPEYASSIYFSARCFGAEAIATSIGYFRLGDVFLAQGNVESALAFFDKVVDIWYKYLSALHTSVETGTFVAPSTGPAFRSLAADDPSAQLEQLSEEHLADGRSQLEQILDTRRKLLGAAHIATGEAQFTLGLFEFLLLGNDTMAESFMQQAHRAYELQLGSAHLSVKHVAKLLNAVKEKLVERGELA